MNFPVKGSPISTLPKLAAALEIVVSNRSVSWFKIGRTNNPASRERAYQSQYAKESPFRGPDYFMAVYQTDSVADVFTVEAALIKQFEHKWKGLNINDHSGGGVSPSYVQYVYVALWEKQG